MMTNRTCRQFNRNFFLLQTDKQALQMLVILIFSWPPPKSLVVIILIYLINALNINNAVSFQKYIDKILTLTQIVVHLGKNIAMQNIFSGVQKNWDKYFLLIFL